MGRQSTGKGRNFERDGGKRCAFGDLNKKRIKGEGGEGHGSTPFLEIPLMGNKGEFFREGEGGALDTAGTTSPRGKQKNHKTKKKKKKGELRSAAIPVLLSAPPLWRRPARESGVGKGGERLGRKGVEPTLDVVGAQRGKKDMRGGGGALPLKVYP